MSFITNFHVTSVSIKIYNYFVYIRLCYSSIVKLDCLNLEFCMYSEYGETWHKAGMLANKQTVFNDFQAAAEYLIEQKYTTNNKCV